jgi:capsular polysaccharide transport system permease protein
VIKRTPWQIQRAVIFALLMREIKTRFGGHWTGVVWMLGLPLLQLFAFVAVNTFLRGRLTRGTYDYAIFLVIALIPYRLCSGLWSQLMNGINSNVGLFNYRQVKPLDTLMARLILEVATDVVVFVLTMLILARLNYSPLMPVNLLGYIGSWAAFVVLGAGMGLLLATLVGPLPRLGVAVGLISLPLYLTSGVIFSVHSFSSEARDWLLLNPLLHLVELSRAAFLSGYQPLAGVSLAYPMMWALTMWALGVCLYWLRRERLVAGE